MPSWKTGRPQCEDCVDLSLFFFFFFWLGGSFSYSKQLHKRLPVSLATSPSDLGPFISLPSLSMTCPHQGSYKISPFPMKHQQTFWRVWLSPRWISGVSIPPPLLSSLIPTPPPPLPIPPLFWWTSDPQHLPWRAVVTETQSKTKEELLRRGKRALSHFLWWSQCCWWEEDALRAAGGGWHGFHRSVFFFFLWNLVALWRKGASAGWAAADLLDWSELSVQPVRTSARMSLYLN